MKKLIFILIVLLSMPVFADITPSAFQKYNGDWFSNATGSGKAVGILWMRAVELQIEAGGELGPGKVWYVDSNVSNAGDGSSWTNAVATLQEAVVLSLADSGANRFDKVWVAPGHNEALTTTDDVDITVAGLFVEGLGTGSDRPRFDYDATGGEFVIGAASVHIKNLTFMPGITIVTHCIDVENAGDWAIIELCEFLEGEEVGTDEFVDVIQVGTTAANVSVIGCKYFSTGTNSNTFLDLTAATIATPSVVGCEIYGAFAEAGIYAFNAVPTNVLVAYNTVTNTTSGQLGIEFQGNATGWYLENKVSTDLIATSYDPGRLSDGGGNLWDDFNTYDTTGVPWARPETGVNQLNATTITAIGAGLTGFGFRGTCDANTAGAGEFTSSELAGFPDDYFNSGWTATILLDDSVAGTAPEFEERDITDYVSAVGGFVVSPVFSSQITLDDEVYIRRYEDSDLTRKATLFGGSGNILYVDSGQAGTPSSAEIGSTWDTAYATIAAAIAGASADNGDVINVAAGHSETIGASQITLNIAGLNIVGLGQRDQQPTFIFDDASSSIDITAADILLENIKFETSTDNVLIALDLAAGADGTHIKDCIFSAATSTDEFLEIIQLASGTDDVIIEGCQFLSQGASSTEAIILEAGICDNLQIIDNWFFGDWIVSAIWSDKANTNCLIARNTIHNITTTQHCIELTAGMTGDIVGNTLYGDTEGSILDSGSMITSGNNIGVIIDVEALPGWFIDQDLNHLIETAVADTSDQVDMSPEIGDDTIFANLMTIAGDTSDYDRRTDSWEALANQMYWGETSVSMTATAQDDELFTVAGGHILITSLTGLVSDQIGGGTNSLQITYNADGVPDIDSVFTTAVDIDADVVGTRYTFTAVAQSILVPVSNTLGNSNLMAPWFCGPGVIEQDSQGSPAGAIKWYMTYRPLETGVTVTAM